MTLLIGAAILSAFIAACYGVGYLMAVQLDKEESRVLGRETTMNRDDKGLMLYMGFAAMAMLGIFLGVCYLVGSFVI